MRPPAIVEQQGGCRTHERAVAVQVPPDARDVEDLGHEGQVVDPVPHLERDTERLFAEPLDVGAQLAHLGLDLGADGGRVLPQTAPTAKQSTPNRREQPLDAGPGTAPPGDEVSRHGGRVAHREGCCRLQRAGHRLTVDVEVQHPVGLHQIGAGVLDAADA